ncbi:HET-domain-containing protein [Trichodelitschia bisporula]|uniref:HET-domain-containing protein n=1 Tax=Trichodelitschia bisporula TaxID=703511 RepID=A0A6G1I058_9PEZI|nr:HET-domain-containing protein [Trichodelitschia bisporula]
MTCEFTFEEFVDDEEAPPYAILSHTWEAEEMSYQEMLHSTYNIKIRAKAGFRKVKKCARMAFENGYKYIWVDTISIDKTSSSELTEAINSMYRWYRGAKVCYAYLADISPDTPVSEMGRSRWFTRGWTLQELIAPRRLEFLSNDWSRISSKHSLCRPLSRITGIRPSILIGRDPSIASIAERMSWASRRQTKRPEDRAYCLLGIFDVHMPMLYGEGAEKAFLRLQEEIMKSSDDHSIFAWTVPGASRGCYRGLLARSPEEFRESFRVKRVDNHSYGDEFSVTNKGLRIKLRLRRVDDEEGLYLATLNCHNQYDMPMGIYLKKITTKGREFARVMVNTIEEVDRDISPTSDTRVIFIRQKITIPPHHPVDRLHGIAFPNISSLEMECQANAEWDSEERCLRFLEGADGWCAAFTFERRIPMSSSIVRQKYAVVIGYSCGQLWGEEFDKDEVPDWKERYLDGPLTLKGSQLLFPTWTWPELLNMKATRTLKADCDVLQYLFDFEWDFDHQLDY